MNSRMDGYYQMEPFRAQLRAFRKGQGGDPDDLETDYPGGGGFTDPTGRFGETDPGLDKTDFLGNEFDDQTMLEPEQVELGPLGLLWVIEGQRIGMIYRIKDHDVVGRKDTQLLLDDILVSSPHARFRVENDKYVLWDCGSKNGTFVNGTRIRAATILKENDRIRIGKTTFVFKFLS